VLGWETIFLNRFVCAVRWKKPKPTGRGAPSAAPASAAARMKSRGVCGPASGPIVTVVAARPGPLTCTAFAPTTLSAAAVPPALSATLALATNSSQRASRSATLFVVACRRCLPTHFGRLDSALEAADKPHMPFVKKFPMACSPSA
jgi:hypothetical protein